MYYEIKQAQLKFEQIKLEQYRLLKELAKANKPITINYKGDGEWNSFEGIITMVDGKAMCAENEDETLSFTQSDFEYMTYDEDNEKVYVILDFDN